MLTVGAYDISVTNSRFTKNNANVLDCINNDGSVFTDCVFSNNNNNDIKESEDYYSFNLEDRRSNVRFVNCDMGNSTFSDRSKATFDNDDDDKGAGSIIGEGSLVMLVALIALITSVASILVNVSKDSPSRKCKRNCKRITNLICYNRHTR